MRVLLVCDIATDGGGNPYTLQLLRALVAHPEIEAVQHGTSWLLWEEPSMVDVVHLHWPEWLITGMEEGPTREEMSLLEEALQYWSNRTTIVATVHNKYPHYRNTEAFRKLYDLVYRYVDGFIHMGRASVRMMRERFSIGEREAQHVIIPHGNYSFFDNGTSRQEGREYLDLCSEDFVILSFGSIRHLEELDLLMEGFNKYADGSKKLVLASKLPLPSRKTLGYYLLSLRLKMNSKLLLMNGHVPASKVSHYTEAADVIVIPRKDTLNSGNLALGFTFGCVVVGPDEGVIGEILRDTNNPVFDSDAPASLAQALQKSKRLAINGKGEENRKIAEDQWNWRKIANQHVAFYRRFSVQV